MTTISSIIISALLLFGCVFIAVGALGIVRFPDVYCRMQAAGIASTMGVFSIAIAAIVFFLAIGKGFVTSALLVILFTLIASPVGAHMMSREAHRSGIKPCSETVFDKLCENKSIQEKARGK